MQKILEEFLSHLSDKPGFASGLDSHKEWASSYDVHKERLQNLFTALFDSEELNTLTDILSAMIATNEKAIDRLNKIMNLRSAAKDIMGDDHGAAMGMSLDGEVTEITPELANDLISGMQEKIKIAQGLLSKVNAMLVIIEISEITA